MKPAPLDGKVYRGCRCKKPCVEELHDVAKAVHIRSAVEWCKKAEMVHKVYPYDLVVCAICLSDINMVHNNGCIYFMLDGTLYCWKCLLKVGFKDVMK